MTNVGKTQDLHGLWWFHAEKSMEIPEKLEVLMGTMWVKQCHKSSMTGNGKHTTYKNGDD